MSKPIEEILAPKPEARLRIYAYSIDDAAHTGSAQGRADHARREDAHRASRRKTQRSELHDRARRVRRARRRHDLHGSSSPRSASMRKGFANAGRLSGCGARVADVKTVLTELRTGQALTGTHHETFAMRPEQAEAVDKTHAYFHSIWKEDMHAVPRFLWNAKMRFGKTFAAYQLAKKLGAKRVLVVTFKPAVEDAWQTDLESHVDFDGWQYLSRRSGSDPTQIDPEKPFVYFGSFQDLLGRDDAGNIKPKNDMAARRQLGSRRSSTSTTSARGATRPRNCSRARTTPSPRRRPSSSTPAIWTVSTKTSASCPRTRPTSCRSPPGRTSTSPARRSGR